MVLTAVNPDSTEQVQEICRKAAEILDAGGLVAMPTETVYGVAASAASRKGVAALRAFKQRPSQPFAIHLPDPEAASRYADVESMVVQRLIRKTMPGPITLIMEVSDADIASRIEALGLREEDIANIYHRNTVGLRCPDDMIARAIAAATGGPLIASSANAKGQRPPVEAGEVRQDSDSGIDLILDGGPCRFARSSTTVRMTMVDGVVRPEVLRAGVFDERYVQKLTRWMMLLVCSGNTCRSPMAEGLARQVLARRVQVSAAQLESRGYLVESAGTFAADGEATTPEAVEAMQRDGIDLSAHRSQRLTLQMIRDADVIFCMAESHRSAVLELVPSAVDRTFLLDASGDIADPFGAALDRYQQCGDLIRRHLEKRIGDLKL